MLPPFPPPFPLICGPTASGKSAVAVELARLLRDRQPDPVPAEILAADAFQIYRGLDIGAAKPTPEERQGIPHQLIDVVEPTDSFTVNQWLDLAEARIELLRARGAMPIVVGGTNLYVRALLDGLFDGPAADPALRAQLTAMDPAQRRAELERVDPAAAARIHFNDVRRSVRALEVHRLTGAPISAHQQQWDRPGAGRTDAILVCLSWPVEALNRRINARVRAMFDRGLLDEARALHHAGRLGPQAREALGYKQLIPVIEGRARLDDAIEQIKIETRRFAKNQRTWLRRLSTAPGALTIDMSASDPARAASQIAAVLANSP